MASSSQARLCVSSLCLRGAGLTRQRVPHPPGDVRFLYQQERRTASVGEWKSAVRNETSSQFSQNSDENVPPSQGPERRRGRWLPLPPLHRLPSDSPPPAPQRFPAPVMGPEPRDSEWQAWSPLAAACTGSTQSHGGWSHAPAGRLQDLVLQPPAVHGPPWKPRGCRQAPPPWAVVSSIAPPFTCLLPPELEQL